MAPAEIKIGKTKIFLDKKDPLYSRYQDVIRASTKPGEKKTDNSD